MSLQKNNLVFNGYTSIRLLLRERGDFRSAMISNLRSNKVIDNSSRLRGKFGTCSPELPEAVKREENKLFQAVRRAFVGGAVAKGQCMMGASCE